MVAVSRVAQGHPEDPRPPPLPTLPIQGRWTLEEIHLRLLCGPREYAASTGENAFGAATSNLGLVGRRIVTGLPRRRGVSRSADIGQGAFSAARFARELSP